VALRKLVVLYAIRIRREPRAMVEGSCSLLLGFDGLLVDEVIADDAGRRVVYCSTDPELAGGAPSGRAR